MIKVFFLCTGNSCRSIIAEAILNKLGGDRFVAFSGGTEPVGKVDPLTIKILKELGYPTASLRSKSWNEFESVPLDCVITVCDSAKDGVCPIWKSQAPRVHWNIPDPSKAKGSDEDRQEEFYRVYAIIEERIKRIIQLPIEQMNEEQIVKSLNKVSKEVAA